MSVPHTLQTQRAEPLLRYKSTLHHDDRDSLTQNQTWPDLFLLYVWFLEDNEECSQAPGAVQMQPADRERSSGSEHRDFLPLDLTTTLTKIFTKYTKLFNNIRTTRINKVLLKRQLSLHTLWEDSTPFYMSFPSHFSHYRLRTEPLNRHKDTFHHSDSLTQIHTCPGHSPKTTQAPGFLQKRSVPRGAGLCFAYTVYNHHHNAHAAYLAGLFTWSIRPISHWN